jgi:pyoverdine/dityrosine biosynthesis protein Dit1
MTRKEFISKMDDFKSESKKVTICSKTLCFPDLIFVENNSIYTEEEKQNFIKKHIMFSDIDNICWCGYKYFHCNDLVWNKHYKVLYSEIISIE